MHVALLLFFIATTLGTFYLALTLKKKSIDLNRRLLALEAKNTELTSENQLARAKEQNLFQKSGEALFLLDKKTGSLIEVNRESERLTGYTQEEVTHLTLKVLFSREHRQRLFRMINMASKKGYAEASEIKFRRKDGSQFIGEIKVKTGQINGKDIIHGSFRDTTRTTNLQLELRRNNRHLTLLNQISHRVTEGHDLAQTLEIILDEVIRSFAISGGGIFLLENRGTEMKLALHRNIPEDIVTDLAAIQPGIGLAGKVVETGRPRMSTNLKSDHRRISNAVVEDNWQAFLAVPFIAEEEPLGVLFVFDRGEKVFNRDDIRLIQAIGRQLGPTLKNAELFDELQWQHRLNYASMRELERSRTALRNNLEQLEQNHRTLQSLNQMKSSFLSLASHELRTPLTTILSGAEFLQEQAEDELAENERRALEVIKLGGERLNHLVDDLLEAARLEAKSIYMAQEAFCPAQMFHDLLREARQSCNDRKLRLERLDFPQEAVIRGDVHYLKRAYSRLIENAIKFTPEQGQIIVAAKLVDEAQVFELKRRLQKFTEAFFDGPLSKRYLLVSIRDTGIGIDEQDQLLIFDKFHEVGDISSHSTSRANFCGKGVGLGLTLVKGVIESHDGMVWVESEGQDKGSCFSTLLPLSDKKEGTHVLG